MSRSIPRLTIRRLMILVGFLAILLGSFIWIRKMVRLSEEYSQITERVQVTYILYSGYSIIIEETRARLDADITRDRQGLPAGGVQAMEQYRRKLDANLEAYRVYKLYLLIIRDKYSRAARYPWHSIPPDPPEPPKPD